MFLDFEDTSISGDWSSQANDFFTAWKNAGWKAGLYTGGSLYKSKFNNDSLVNSGIYRWIAAYGTNDGTAQSGYEPANYDAWQYTSSGGIGSYTGALDKSYDKTGKLITVGSTPTTLDPYEPATPTAGAYVGTGIDTTGLGGGRAYGYSTNGNSFYSALTPFGFIFREVDADRMWTLIKPKIPTTVDQIRLWQTISTTTDFNTLSSDGRYWIQVKGNTNSIVDTWGYLIVSSPIPTRVMQEFTSDTTGNTFKRVKIDDTWSDWKQVTTW